MPTAAEHDIAWKVVDEMTMKGAELLRPVFHASDVAVEPRIDNAIAPATLSALDKFADFRRASTEGGLSRDEFDMFPPTRRTLRQFIAACHDLDGQIRDLMLPSPDVTAR